MRLKHRFAGRGRVFGLNVEFNSDDSCLAFFGHSGSGKTLTMRAAAGLFRPREGFIRIGGRVVFDSAKKIRLPARARRLGYLFQEYALFPHLTVRENVAFALGWFPGRKEQRRVEELLDIFELSHIAGLRPESISGGQKQRAALARALAGKPDLLLLDEPFSALDQLMRERVRANCKLLLERFNTPSVIITHDPADVIAFAKGVVLFDNGTANGQVDLAGLAGGGEDQNELRSCLAREIGLRA